ncbi:t-SNARE, partial [Pholiota molesta]
FQDIEAGQAHPARSSSLTPHLQSSLSLQVFKMNANVQGILKLVDQLGTGKDSASLRKSLQDLKKLSECRRRCHTKRRHSRRPRTISKCPWLHSKEPTCSVEKQRTVVAGVKLAVDDEQHHPPFKPRRARATVQEQRQAQILQAQLSPHELAYQESLIQEREAEIREIETGMHQISEIFHDLGTLVNQQGSMIDNIELNISSVAVDTSSASQELTTAAEYQRRAGKRAACLMLILAIVVAIVLLAVLA